MVSKKLHLGCGERYLQGYINIDFPPSEHPVQINAIADVFADILSLHHPANSVDEVRLHHVFEHFSRPTACALIASWWTWLKPGGVLHIEVPDFNRTAWVVLNPVTAEKERYVALRHIFGSQEAGWAVHQEGWSSVRLTRLIKSMGFEKINITKNSWRGTYNFEIMGLKRPLTFSQSDFERIAQGFLKQYCVDDSPAEQRLLFTWMSAYNKQIEKTWAH
jgi:predicted SAM-dependent methyltransferase